MENALAELNAVRKTERTAAERHRALLGQAMLQSALARQESRGAHTRTDFPDRDDATFQKTTVARLTGDEIVIEFWDIPERNTP